jgi:hypothetical protein
MKSNAEQFEEAYNKIDALLRRKIHKDRSVPFAQIVSAAANADEQFGPRNRTQSKYWPQTAAQLRQPRGAGDAALAGQGVTPSSAGTPGHKGLHHRHGTAARATRRVGPFPDAAVGNARCHCRWEILGPAEEVQRSDIRRAILDALTDSKEPLSPSEIAAATGIDQNSIAAALFRMVRTGEVTKQKRERYALASGANIDNTSQNIERTKDRQSGEL